VIFDGQVLTWSSSEAGAIRTRDAFFAQPDFTRPAPGSPLALAQVYPWLYWTQHSSAGEVRRISLQNGATYAQGGADAAVYPNIIAIDASGSTVAWTSGSGVFATKADASFTDGTVAELIDPATDGRGIVVDGDTVYYLAGGELRAKARGSSGPAKALATVCSSYRWLAQSRIPEVAKGPTALFWTCGAGGGVFRLPKPAP
jgi:hypothetical protein